MTTTLASIPVGQRVKVISLRDDQEFAHRLREMGVTAGTILHVIRLAPLGDPIEIQVRGYKLTLRKEEAECVQVEGLSD